jgi:hypothetical protein
MKIEAYCGCGFIGAEHKTIMNVPDEEIENMTEDEKEEYILENYVEPWGNQYVEMYFKECE